MIIRVVLKWRKLVKKKIVKCFAERKKCIIFAAEFRKADNFLLFQTFNVNKKITP